MSKIMNKLYLGSDLEFIQELLGEDMGYTEFLNQLDSDSARAKQEESEMKLDDVYPSSSTSLKAEDLKGKEIRLTIESYDVREFDSDKGKQNKIVLSFQNTDKTLVCNKTNGRRIAAAFSDDLDAWKNQEIILYPDKTDFGGQLVDCIRVRIPVEAADDSDLPF